MPSIRVKNWQDFQHYKNRRPPWIKLHRILLDDFEFCSLPDASAALAPRIWLIASESDDGSLPADLAELAFRLRWPVERVSAALKPLIEKGFLIVDGAASEMLARCKREARLETETETETEERERVGRGTATAPACLPPEQRAEDETRRTITRLQIDLASRLARLAEHVNSRQSVTAWCREVTAYERPDGTKVKGVADYRTISSVDRLERSISDADWWLEELDRGQVVGAPALVEAARGSR